MTTRPSAGELIEAVRVFLAETVRPHLQGHTAFHAKVAENALAMVARELDLADRADSAARERLARLLRQPGGDLDTLSRALCDAIRTGQMTLETPGLLEHLRASAIDRCKIDQPRYSGLALATKTGDS